MEDTRTNKACQLSHSLFLNQWTGPDNASTRPEHARDHMACTVLYGTCSPDSLRNGIEFIAFSRALRASD